MKNMKLLALLVALSVTAVHAQKSQFGFVVKVGNATKPKYMEQTSGYNREVNQVNAGSVILAGITTRYQLGKGLFLTGELMYRFTDVSYRYDNFTVYSQSSRRSLQSDRFFESSFILPVKLEWAPFRKRRTAIGVGFGLSKVIAGEVSTNASVSNSLFPQFISEFRPRKLAIIAGDFPVEWSLNAGISHQLSAQTSIGLEITVEPYRRELSVPLSIYAVQDCRCSYYSFLEPPGLLSLTLAIRHFLMPDKE